MHLFQLWEIHYKIQERQQLISFSLLINGNTRIVDPEPEIPLLWILRDYISLTRNAVWQVSFPEYDQGYFDRDEDRVGPGPYPFAPDKVLTMCPE